jgi:tripeptidyl-peptidase I
MSFKTLSLLVAVLALATLSTASLNVKRTAIEFAQPQDVPAGWERVDTAAPAHPLTLTISLTNRNLDRLEALFWERTDPRSPTWRQWLSLEELTELVAPADSVIATTRAWLLTYGITDVHLTASRDFLVVRTTVAKATQLLNAEFSQWHHRETGRTHVCTLGPYSAPSPLAAHIDYIAGVWGFPAQQRVSIVTERNQLADNPNPSIRPSDLLTAYNCSYTATNNKSSFSVAEFQSQFYSPTDLADFFNRFVPEASAADAQLVKGVGLNLPNAPGVEASLDIEYAMGVAPGVELTFWSNPSFNFWSDITSWLQQIADTPNAPWVHSVSYGDQRESQQPSTSYKDSTSAEFQKAGVRGLSIVFASGDSGAGCHLCRFSLSLAPHLLLFSSSVVAVLFAFSFSFALSSHCFFSLSLSAGCIFRHQPGAVLPGH